jgi:hypothetical protein
MHNGVKCRKIQMFPAPLLVDLLNDGPDDGDSEAFAIGAKERQKEAENAGVVPCSGADSSPPIMHDANNGNGP